MENLILVHALLGGIALLSGTVVLMLKKGTLLHKRLGNVFFYTLLISSIISLIVSVAEGHENAFLFSIGLFTLYLLGSGKRAVKQLKGEKQDILDAGMAFSMIIIGLAMIVGPYLLLGKINVVLAVFGAIGVLNAALDLRLQRKPYDYQKSLTKHLSKMIGGYIAAFTAFIVVNNVLPGNWGWLAPTAIGGAYIAYWIVTVNAKKRPSAIRKA